MILPTGELESKLSFEGIPSSMDFLHQIPGDEFKFIAKNLESEVISLGFRGIMIKSKVMRNTVLRCLAGTRIHELTDPEENIYAMSHYPHPKDWT